MDPYEAFQQGAATNQPGAPIESLWQAFLRAFYHIWFVRIGEDILSLQAARMRQIQSCLWILLLIFNIVPWLHQAVTAVMIYPCTAAATAPYLNGLCPLVLPLRPPQQGPSPMNIWNPSISPTSSADNISSEIATMLTSHVAICDVGLRLEHQMEKLQKHNATPAQDALIAQLGKIFIHRRPAYPSPKTITDVFAFVKQKQKLNEARPSTSADSTKMPQTHVVAGGTP